jgi:hypothetical protein
MVSRSSSTSSQPPGIACTPSHVPAMLPAIAAVLSLSPEWFAASRTDAAKSSGCASTEYTAIASASSATQPWPSVLIALALGRAFFERARALAKRIVDLAVNGVDRRMNGELKRRSVLEVSDDARQRTGRRVTGRVTVRPARRHVADDEWLDAPSIDEPARCRSHHASAALAVIGGCFMVVLEHRDLLEGADARLPRRSG